MGLRSPNRTENLSSLYLPIKKQVGYRIIESSTLYMNETSPIMPTRNPANKCNCENQTNLIDQDGSPEVFDNPVIIAVVASVGFIALLTIIVFVWSIRRCYSNNKTRQSWDLPAVAKNEEDKSTKLERSRTFAGTARIDMYGGSLQDLRHNCEDREVRVVVQRDLHSAYSHTFLHRGDHNNTIINSLAATWSIQTLPHPRHPGEVVISKTTENPIYASTVIAPKRCVSSNALYESADSILPRIRDFRPSHYSRENLVTQAESPVYERIIEYKKKPGTSSMDKNTK